MKIASESLLGGSYVEITPGASEVELAAGRRDPQHPELGQPLNLLMRFGTGE